MQSGNAWIAVDWGTTNRRAYRLEGASAPIDRFADARGIIAIESGGFPAAIGELRARLGDLPMLLAGMIGSNRGWIEAPYIPCPVTLADLIARAIAVPGARARIIPGASFVDSARSDVMRGEEVQLLGAVAAGLAPATGLICHPGTHAKWARLEQGALVSFRTAMTGELFALLAKHSILAPQLGAAVVPDDAFVAGVDRALGDPGLAAALFTIRARAILQNETPQHASAFASGLLIGDDVRTGLRGCAAGESVTLIGDPKLTALYARALAQAGRDCATVDGEAAFIGGITAIAEGMR